jgi:hypothetical protein
MKVAVLNYTGTVGKTTISAHLLSPRMADAPIFAVETINETAEGLGSVDVEKMAGEKFKALLKKPIAYWLWQKPKKTIPSDQSNFSPLMAVFYSN